MGFWVSQSRRVKYIAVDTVDGVGVNIWTCSGTWCSSSEQNLSSSPMCLFSHPGWAAIR